MATLLNSLAHYNSKLDRKTTDRWKENRENIFSGLLTYDVSSNENKHLITAI